MLTPARTTLVGQLTPARTTLVGQLTPARTTLVGQLTRTRSVTGREDPDAAAARGDVRPGHPDRRHRATAARRRPEVVDHLVADRRDRPRRGRDRGRRPGGRP